MGVIAVVCEPPVEAGSTMSSQATKIFGDAAKAAGFTGKDFRFVRLCDPIPKMFKGSDKRTWACVEPHLERVHAQVEKLDPECVVTLGNLAAKAYLGKAVEITKARGSVVMHGARRVYPVYGPSMIMAVPHNEPAFATDMAGLHRLRANDWDESVAQSSLGGDYRYVDDLQFLVDLKPRVLSVDTEGWNSDADNGGTALRWQHPCTRVLTVQLCWAPGKAVAVPIDLWNTVFPGNPNRLRVYMQLKRMLEDPSIRKVGQNCKYDHHILLSVLKIKVRGWTHDSLMLSHYLDEDMQRRSQDDLVRRWLPKYAGYADAFNRETDKSHMEKVDPQKLLTYGCGDVDTNYQLVGVLAHLLRQDRLAWNGYKKISMPGIVAFTEMERTGMLVDKDQLRKFSAEIATKVEEEYRWLIAEAPAAIKLRHMDAAVAKKLASLKTDKARERWETQIRAEERRILSFTRKDFVKDILFDREGFRLKPVVWTKSTADLYDEEEHFDEREASTSAKLHMPYFFGHAKHGEYVKRLAAYQKLVKLLTTYLGEERCTDRSKKEKFGKPTGIWQYIGEDGYIHPSFILWVTNTGRTNSRDPNGQNFPSRGALAKEYMKMFVAPPGYRVIAADLSQMELRLVAWFSGDPVMMRIYLEGGDIHTYTAKKVMGLSDEEWDALPSADFVAQGVMQKGKKTLRTQAKAINFGYVYGMSWRKFLAFAFTEYGVELTEAEAEAWQENYFATYPGLRPWHDRTKREAALNGGMRCKDGAFRHLPILLGTDQSRMNEEERDFLRRKVGDAQRQAINAPVQRLGSQFGVAAMRRLVSQNQGEWLKPIAFVHDAIYAYVKVGREREGIDALVYAMQTVPMGKWFGNHAVPPIPIVAEPDVGVSFGEKVELGDWRGKSLADMEKAKAKIPDWFRPLQEEQDVTGFTGAKPAWWRDELDDVDEEAFWMGEGYTREGLLAA